VRIGREILANCFTRVDERMQPNSFLSSELKLLNRGEIYYLYDSYTNGIYDIDSLSADAILKAMMFNDGGATVFRQLPADIAGHIRSTRPKRYSEKIRKSMPLVPSFTETDYQNIAILALTITESCNMRCRYCPYSAGVEWDRRHSERAMPVEVAMQSMEFYLRRSKDADSRTVVFYGGEPLLNFDLIKVIVNRYHPGEYNIRYSIVTNGLSLDDDVLRFVSGHGLFLQISLDGPMHYNDAHRIDASGEGTFRRVVQNLAVALQTYPTLQRHTSIHSTLAPPVDLAEIDAFFGEEQLRELLGVETVPYVTVSPADTYGIPRYSDPSCRPAMNVYARYREQFVATRLNCENSTTPVLTSMFDDPIIKLYHRNRRPLHEVSSVTGACVLGVERLHVDVDGNLQPCERVAPGMCIGNVWKGFDYEIINRYRKSYERVYREHCAKCWALRLCRQCFIDFSKFGETSVDNAWIERGCRAERAYWEDQLLTYAMICKGGKPVFDWYRRSITVA